MLATPAKDSGTKSVAEVFLNTFREVVTTATVLSADCVVFLKQSPSSSSAALRNSFVAASSAVMPHNQSAMGNAESKFDDYNELLDASWTAGWTDGWRFQEMEEEQQAVMDVIAEEEVAAAIEERIPELLRLDDCALEAEEEERQREETKRESHKRAKDLWSSNWGRLLLNPKLNEPKSWEHRTFVRRFRLPYQLFKQVRSIRYCLNLHQLTYFYSLNLAGRAGAGCQSLQPAEAR
jgi:hypothetical protein